MKKIALLGLTSLLTLTATTTIANHTNYQCPDASTIKTLDYSHYDYTGGYVQFLNIQTDSTVILDEGVDNEKKAQIDRDDALTKLDPNKTPKLQSSQRGEVCIYMGVYSDMNPSAMKFPIIMTKAIPSTK